MDPDSDTDSEYEEEEVLIYADFKNQLIPPEISDTTAIKIIGFEGDPIAEVNGNIFKGTYDHTMGTSIFFENDLNCSSSDPLFESSCRQKYKYLTKASKVINFKRIFVEKKPCEPSSTGDEKLSNDNEDMETTSSPVEDSLKIKMSYEEAIKQFPMLKNIA